MLKINYILLFRPSVTRNRWKKIWFAKSGSFLWYAGYIPYIFRQNTLYFFYKPRDSNKVKVQYLLICQCIIRRPLVEQFDLNYFFFVCSALSDNPWRVRRVLLHHWHGRHHAHVLLQRPHGHDRVAWVSEISNESYIQRFCAFICTESNNKFCEID